MWHHILNGKKKAVLGWIAVFLALVQADFSHSAIITDNFFATVDQFGLSPFWTWKVIETEHFILHFPSELASIAQKAANYCEEANQVMSPVFQWQPSKKARVFVIDNQDSANGMASAFGGLGMVLWVTPPDSWSKVEYYDDWLRLLIFHEYTHYLNLDTTGGIIHPLRYVFGDLLLPNGAWQKWMLEGLAVYMETQFTTAGRGRSIYYEALLRAAVEAEVLDTSNFLTLDKMQGTNNFFPWGDTRYIFGYHLMNQSARTVSPPKDFKGTLALGQLSKDSGSRIPFLVDQLSKNVVGIDWYTIWDNFVRDTNVRVNQELDQIKTQPLTSFTSISDKDPESGIEVTAIEASPNGKLLAYSAISSDRRSGLYLKNLETLKTARLDDKLDGFSASFTPDSKHLAYSERRQHTQYYSWSDLRMYDLEEDTSYALTENLRARDPNISKDGQWITFTITDHGVTGLALAPLLLEEGRYKLGKIEKVYTPPLYDHVGTPKFTKSGDQIVFSFHPNGKSQEDLVSWDMKTGKTSVIVSNGGYNQFPTFNSTGDLYFVSNVTGVDNLYRYSTATQDSIQVTNFTTSVGFPSFGPENQVFASVLTSKGWDLVQIHLDPKIKYRREKLAVTPPAPGIVDRKELQTKTYSVSDYSSFPSLSPRFWTPLLSVGNSFTAGAQVFGFDAINVHRYSLASTYNTRAKTVDGYLLYSTRALGPTVDVVTDILTGNVKNLDYSRQFEFAASASFPILWTWSSLVPAVGWNFQKIFNYTDGVFSNVSPFVPSLDTSLSFSDAESSILSITNEGGRSTRLGTRVYFGDNEQVWKVFLADQEFIRITPHSVLSPSVKATWVSHVSTSYLPASSILSGRSSSQLFNTLAGDGLSRMAIRGYPDMTFSEKSTAVAGLDFRFPINRVFRGLGTWPALLNNLYGLTFVEVATFPYSTPFKFLSSVGGGLRLSTELFIYLPATFSLEIHQGLRPDYGGSTDVFFQILAAGLPF